MSCKNEQVLCYKCGKMVTEDVLGYVMERFKKPREEALPKSLQLPMSYIHLRCPHCGSENAVIFEVAENKYNLIWGSDEALKVKWNTLIEMLNGLCEKRTSGKDILEAMDTFFELLNEHHEGTVKMSQYIV